MPPTNIEKIPYNPEIFLRITLNFFWLQWKKIKKKITQKIWKEIAKKGQTSILTVLPGFHQDLTIHHIEKFDWIVHRVFLGSFHRNQGVLWVFEDPVSHSNLHRNLGLMEAHFEAQEFFHSSWRGWSWFSREGDSQEFSFPWEFSISNFSLRGEQFPFAYISLWSLP